MVGLSVNKTFRTLGVPPNVTSTLCKNLSTVSARASYAIYLAYDSKIWGHGQDLIVLQHEPLSIKLPPLLIKLPRVSSGGS